MGEVHHVDQRTMVVFPNAKVNVGLQVRRRRDDGFHDIESLFLPIPWHDSLELEILNAGQDSTILTHGLSIPGDDDNNLILKAHALLSESHDLPPVRFHLAKAIPMGAGLGGGSADGAFALVALNRLLALGIETPQLEGLAAQLGSDCPFFIRNACAHVMGRGEYIRPVELQLGGWWIALIHPGVHVPTAAAFSWVTPDDARPNLLKWTGSSPSEWDDTLRNDFTLPVSERHPVIGEALQRLKDHGATFTDMSGSGSTVFGFFHEAPPAELLQGCPVDWTTWQGRFPA